MVRSADVLPKNTAAWDRALHMGCALAIFFGLLALTRNPIVLLAGGIVAGFALVATSTGF